MDGGRRTPSLPRDRGWFPWQGIPKWAGLETEAKIIERAKTLSSDKGAKGDFDD